MSISLSWQTRGQPKRDFPVSHRRSESDQWQWGRGTHFTRELRGPSMPRVVDVVDRWLASKEEHGRRPSTVYQYRWVARSSLDELASAGRTTDPRKWGPADASWLLQRFRDDRWRISIIANMAGFAGNPVFDEVDALERMRTHGTRGSSSDQLRALLGIDEGSRRPKLVVLLGLDRGPSDVEWIQLPAEYIDLAGNRQLLRRIRTRKPIRVDPGGSRKERARELLKDDRVKRWVEWNASMNRETAERRLGDLSRILDGMALSVEQALELGRNDPGKLEDLLRKWVEKRKREGRQSGTLLLLLGSLRDLFTKEGVPFRAWPKIRHLGSPTLTSERVPTSSELQLICAQLEPRSKAAALLIAQAGLRPGVLCRSDARVGAKALQLKHLPDLKLKPRRHFERIPFRIDVPAELSKMGRSYLTFGGQEAADALLAYLDGRRKPVFDMIRRVRTRNRETLRPKSYVIAARHSGKLTGKAAYHVGDPVEVKVILASIRKGMRKVQPEGVRWRPYVLRHYFSTRLLLAELRGLMKRDVREHMLGHTTGVSGRYNLGKRLPDEIVDEMRSMYANSLPFLETPRTVRDAEDLRRRKGPRLVRPLTTGVLTPQEKERFPGLTDAEFVDELSRGLNERGGETARQQVVPIAEAKRLMKQGWQFVSRFGAGEVVVRSP